MILLDNTPLWLWLNQQVCLNRNKQLKLMEHFGNIKNIYDANLSDYAELDFLKEDELNLLTKKELDLSLADEERLLKLGGGVITIDSPAYPEILKNISSPPTVLYFRGVQADLNERLCIAMVGTRKATYYGKDCAYTLARELSSMGVSIVSGMAMGIDAKSHEGAISGGSPTIAVIGCGVDICYPLSNSKLMDSILKNGMVISEYPLGTHPEKYHFPERNRIISGMCQGTLVVEADFKSGSLITAKNASEQNRDVFAVPGNINSTYSKGTNYLLKDGAHFVTCAEDILSYYRFDYPNLMSKPITKGISDYEESSPQPGSPEEKIINAIGEETLHTDTICQLTGLDIGTVNASLLMMELTAKVIKLPGGFYTRAKSI